MVRTLASNCAQVFCRRLARFSIGDDFEGDLLPLVQPIKASAFDRADVHEDVVASVIWLNEAETLLAVEPFHGSLGHIAVPLHVIRRAPEQAVYSRSGEENRQSDAGLPRGEVVRPKLDPCYVDHLSSPCKVY
jgi:hypothetical protein